MKNIILVGIMGCGKTTISKLLSEKLKIGQDEIFTIGDGYSDIEMIKDYKGYAMKESVEELKKVAIGKIESVSELIEEIEEGK